MVAVAAALAVLAVPAARAGEGTGRYIVVLTDSVDSPTGVAEAQVRRFHGDLRHVYSHALKGYSAELPEKVVKSLRRNPTVASIEPDVRGRVASQSTPTGPERIFAATNEALFINEEDDVRADVDVAVIDTGVDAEHPDLNVVEQVDCHGEAYPDCVEEQGEDAYGHGTAVAGAIGALDNDLGVVGVAPGARLWSVRVFDDEGYGELSEFIAGIDWVTGTREDEDPTNDIDVVNASAAFYEVESSEAFDAALKASREAGIVQVVPAGNISAPVQWVPGNSPDAITVSALADYDGEPNGESSPTCEDWGDDDELSSFSGYGKSIDITAPGVCVYTTWPGEAYTYASGTSLSSPHVAGAAAILASQDPPDNLEEVEEIGETVIDEGNFNWTDTSEDGIQEPLLDVGDEEVFSISPSDSTPKAWTLDASDIYAEEEDGKATLHGMIKPQGLPTSYHFEWGDSAGELSNRVPVEDMNIGVSPPTIYVEQEIEGLDPSEVYYYRVVAENYNGETLGETESFSTPQWQPETSPGVTDIGTEEATLGAAIYPEGFETTYHFEWGESEEYGNTVPVPDGSVGPDKEGTEVSHTLNGLRPGTNYYYRLIAENANGSSFFTHPGSFRTLRGAGFLAGGYPAEPAGVAEALHLESPFFSLDCQAPVFGGEFEGPSSSLSAHGYEGQHCGPDEFDMGDCEFVFYPSDLGEEGESEGQVGIEPPGCGPIAIEYKYGGWNCPIEIESQQVFPVSLKNEGEGEEATVAIELNESAAPKYSLGGACWPFLSEREDLTWEGSWEVSATDPETEYQFGLQIAQITPEAITEPATDIVVGESSSAKLNGVVLPAVSGDFDYHFEFGTNKAYGSMTESSPVEGEEELPVSETIEGLSPDTVYHYRLVVSDEEEEIVSYGQDRTFLAATPELEPPGEEFPASFSLAGEEEVVLRGGESLVECITVGEEAAVGGEGQFEDETSGTATLTLHNCKSSGTNCTTLGEEAGTITTDELPFDLLYLSDGKPGVLFLPNAESERLAMVKCAFGLVEVEIAGSGVLAQITDPLLGQSSSTMSIDLDATEVGEGEYAQEYTETHSGAEYGLQVTINEGKPGAASLEAGAVATFGGDAVLALVGSFGPALEPSGEEFPAAFSLVGEDEVVLRSGESLVECKTGAEEAALGGEGEFEDAASGTATLTLHNCKSSGTSCTTSGEQLGTIKAEGLRFHLIYLSDGEPGVVFLPNAESGQLATAKCAFGLVKVEVAGNGVLAQITDPALNEVSQALTLDLDANEVGEGEYAQEYTEIEAGTEYGLQVTINEGKPGAASLEAEATASFEGGEGELVE